MIRSGGFFYHLRALRYKDDYWRSHLQGVANFLEAWDPKSDSILLVGPSGGYSLPVGWLDRFKRVVAYEPDPLARWIFERRHRIRPEWIRRKFPFRSLDPFRRIGDFSGAILFCNILGQVSIPSLHRLSRGMRQGLEGREWASYHDALSGSKIEFDLEDARPGRASLHEMKGWIYVSDRSRRLIEVNDHSAPELFKDWEGLQFRYWQWRIVPAYTHLIEGVFQKKPTDSPRPPE